MRQSSWVFVVGACVLLAPRVSHAFCGFYVAGSDAQLVSDATQVVLMRYGTTTIQSMQNNYDGPPEDFAMVVPVPQVLQKQNVKTLPKGAFDTIDTLTSPRLVEYWEQNPCPQYHERDYEDEAMPMQTSESGGLKMRSKSAPPPKVKVEAKFSVAEYDIVILSATESTALDRWLRQNGYKIPDGADAYLAPYVSSGMYFFVAKVDVDKVERAAGGRAVLSPIRFHYENDAFFLPVRLGMINSAGKQDLVVYILAQQFRFEVANRPNAFIPTNLEVKNEVRGQFPTFFDGIFAATIEKHPGAVMTEYSWGSSKCDPCPGPTLSQEDILTFGGNVISEEMGAFNWVVTRLHARYGADDIGEDLVFEKAAPIAGGREVRDHTGALEQGVIDDSFNNFQARYIIRHEWAGPVECANPQFGIWGGPPNGGSVGVMGAPSANTRGEAPSTNVEIDYAKLVKDAVPDASVVPARDVALPRPTGRQPRGPGGSMCAGCSSVDAAANGLLALMGLVMAAVLRRRRAG